VVGLMVLQATPASAAPDVVKTGMCSGSARWWLEVTLMENPAPHRPVREGIKVRFEVHQSPPGHSWRIHFRHMQHNIGPIIGHVFFEGTRVASDSGVFELRVRRPDFGDGVVGEAVDPQTGEVCKVSAWYR
jgi:hypothetical protein